MAELSKRAKDILSEYPGPATLRPGFGFSLLAVVLLLVIPPLGWGYWRFVNTLEDPPLDLILLAYGFGVGALFAEVAMIWLVWRHVRGEVWLRLDGGGFESRFWVTSRGRWADVSEFQFSRLGSIVYRDKNGAKSWSFNRAFLEGFVQIPGRGVTYGFRRTGDLIGLLNAWRERALSTKPGG
jgi:hypothetical protein